MNEIQFQHLHASQLGKPQKSLENGTLAIGFQCLEAECSLFCFYDIFLRPNTRDILCEFEQGGWLN